MSLRKFKLRNGIIVEEAGKKGDPGKLPGNPIFEANGYVDEYKILTLPSKEETKHNKGDLLVFFLPDINSALPCYQMEKHPLDIVEEIFPKEGEDSA